MPARLRGALTRRPSRRRTLLALVLALALGLPLVTGAVGPARRPAVSAASPASTAVRWGLQHLGARYQYGGTGPGGYDCSGFSRAAYAAAGVALPHSSRDQYRLGPRIPRAQWQVGDLIYWASSTSNPATIYHVGMYVGNGTVLHQTEPGDVARIMPIFSPDHVMPYATRPGGLATQPLLPVSHSGDSVRDVQLRLRANGQAVPVTGVYDGATAAAVRRFQGAHGLSGTGQTSYPTWLSLVRHGVTNRAS